MIRVKHKAMGKSVDGTYIEISYKGRDTGSFHISMGVLLLHMHAWDILSVRS